MQHLAIYDMDKTITRAPTWMRFLVASAKRRAPWRLALLPLAGVAGLAYALKLTDRARLKAYSHRLLLGSATSVADMDRLAEAFAAQEMEHGVLAGARERIAADRSEGYRLVMATASHGYYAAAIGRLLGFDAVIATKALRDSQGRIISILDGDNCYGAAKLHMILEWVEREALDRSGLYVRAYSDHVSDAPMLEWADEAYAVNPHKPLAAMALKKGWQRFDWC